MQTEFNVVVRNLSVITAVEESNEQDSSMVRGPIEIMSNPRHNRGHKFRVARIIYFDSCNKCVNMKILFKCISLIRSIFLCCQNYRRMCLTTSQYGTI